MKIALIAPPYPLEEIPSPPLGLTCIAAVCEAAGAEVAIFDYIVRGYSDTKLRNELTEFAPDIVGTNSVTMNFKRAAAILRQVKQENPDIITIMGGPHVSFHSGETLELYPEIDIIVRGEGEATMAELLSVIRNRTQWHTIQGISFNDQGRHVDTGFRPFIQDLDALPLPARHLLPMARYQALGFPVSIITSRGCPNQCIFCLGRRMVGHKVRFRSPESIADEIEELQRSHGISTINIADDLFTANRHRVKEVCSEITRRNLTVSWSAFSRVNTIDADTLRIMKRAGCHSVSFGIESGNAEMLKRVRKGITIDQARNAASACREAGINGHVSFIVGLPGESPETLSDTLALQKELDIEFGYHFLAPFPGTTVRENSQEYDLEILSQDWDLYNANTAIVRTSSLSPEEMNAFVWNACEQTRESWEAMKLRYENKTATVWEQMRVGGHYRMEMIFQLLSQDIIEQQPEFSADKKTALKDLCRRIAVLTGMDSGFTEFTMNDLVARGYIRSEATSESTRFSWNHSAAVPEPESVSQDQG